MAAGDTREKKEKEREWGIGWTGEIAREEKSQQENTINNICIAITSKGSRWDQCWTVQAH